MKTESDYYVSHRKRYLADFDQMTRLAHAALGRYFDQDAIPDVIAETRRHFETLIPQIPYIGGKKTFTRFLVYTGMVLAVYRTGKAHGKALEEIGRMIYEIDREVVSRGPAALLRRVVPSIFSRRHIQKIRDKAKESHKRLYPGDFVFDFIEGDGVHFDYGVDYLECGNCKFLAQQGAAELAPYLCPADILYSEAFGWGLVRTQTLAEGAGKCDFRFKKGGPTRVAVPAALDALVTEKRL